MSELKMPRVLVTGGSGFIGTNLINSLVHDGVQVINLDINRPVIPDHDSCRARADILDYPEVIRVFHDFRPEYVVHLAARTDLDENAGLEGYAANTDGVRNICRAVNDTVSVKRAIISSSMLVCRPGYVPESDDDYAPTTLYGRSKVLTEKITRDSGMSCVWTLVRLTTIWGPYHMRLKGELFRLLKKGLYMHPGNRPVMKTYGYVGNTVFQIRKILDGLTDMVNGKTYYLGDPAINLRHWVGEFSKRLKDRDVIELPLPLMKSLARAGDFMAGFGFSRFPMTSFRLGNMTIENVLDINPILEVSGILPFTMTEGIDETVRWLNQAG